MLLRQALPLIAASKGCIGTAVTAVAQYGLHTTAQAAAQTAAAASPPPQQESVQDALDALRRRMAQGDSYVLVKQAALSWSISCWW